MTTPQKFCYTTLWNITVNSQRVSGLYACNQCYELIVISCSYRQSHGIYIVNCDC